MAPHSSVLAWRIPGMVEPDGLPSMGSHGVGHDIATSLSLFTFMHWRRKWQPTPVFLPGESRGWWSLVGCRLWGRTELDTTEATQTIPGLGRSPGGGHGNPLQYVACIIPMDRGAWWATVHRVAELKMTEATQHAHTWLQM